MTDLPPTSGGQGARGSVFEVRRVKNLQPLSMLSLGGHEKGPSRDWVLSGCFLPFSTSVPPRGPPNVAPGLLISGENVATQSLPRQSQLEHQESPNGEGLGEGAEAGMSTQAGFAPSSQHGLQRPSVRGRAAGLYTTLGRSSTRSPG